VKGIIKQVLLATCVIGAPTSVFAYPFNPNPQSFQNYMNTRNWSDGSKVYFQNLNTCREYGAYNKSYECKSGYATITNPKGTQVCDITYVGYVVGMPYSYGTSGCRYK
jgi:hypothetical protein